MTTSTFTVDPTFTEVFELERSYIREQSRPQWFRHDNYHDLLAEHATPRTEPIATDDILGIGEVRHCYHNCLEAIHAFDDYTYYEGLATTSLTALILVRHAWLVDNKTGRVVDPTWVHLLDDDLHPRDATATYLGIPFASQFIFKRAAQTGYPCVFERDWAQNHEILKRGFQFDELGRVTDLGPERLEPTKETA